VRNLLQKKKCLSIFNLPLEAAKAKTAKIEGKKQFRILHFAFRVPHLLLSFTKNLH